jgi:hypothetical protein
MAKGTQSYRIVVANIVTEMGDRVHKKRIKLSAIKFSDDDHISLK